MQKRGTVCSIFKLKVVRKPKRDKMLMISSTLTREAVMSVFISFRVIITGLRGFFAMNENFSRSQLAREEHNASFYLSDKM